MATLALVLGHTDCTHAQNPIAESQVHLREANEAYRDADYGSFTRSLEKALELNPASFTTRYNLACGYARTAQPDKALELLRGLVDARVDFGMALDPDLESLRDLPEFRALVAELEASIVPVINSTPRYTVEQLGLIPEGIAFDAQTGRLFFGSMRTGDIYVLDEHDQLSKFATVDRESRLSAIGMTVDRGRGLLWAVGTSFNMAEHFDADAPTRTGVFGFNLTSGELEREYLVDETVAGLNDVAVGPSGKLYASGGVLHVLDPDEDRLVPLATTPDLFGSNGITTDPSGDTLFVSSYPVGIGAINLETGQLRFLEAPEGTSLYGIDGLYWYRGGLVGIQNGIQPWRLLRMTLDDGLTEISVVHVIEFANDAAVPTTGAIVGNEIHYIGQGPAPDPAPSQFPEWLTPFVGKTVIRTAPLVP